MAEAPSASPETTRRKYLRAEAAIRSLSWIYFLAAVLLLATIISNFRKADLAISNRVCTAGLLMLLSACFVWVGIQFLRLNPVIRIPGLVLSGLGLLNFPVGTVLNSYALLLMLSRSGRFVLGADYHRVVLNTPSIRYRMSPLMIGIGVLLAAALLSLLFLTEEPAAAGPFPRVFKV